MAVPSTNVKFSNIYAEANGAYSSGMLSMLTMSFFSYFAGPNGSNSQPANNWGQGEGSGANRIYGTSAKTTNIQVGDFDGLTYFYDNSTFQVTLDAINNLTNTGFPPPNNDVNVTVELYDSTFSYQYMVGGGTAPVGIPFPPGTYGPASVSQTSDPIIYRGYWKVTLAGMPGQFTGGNFDLSINGTTKATGVSISTGPGGTTIDSGTYGTEDVASYGGYTGLYFYVNIY